MSPARTRTPAALAAAVAAILVAAPLDHAAESVARQWDEQILDAIRIDTPRPTVHAYNLFTVSGAMYDAWSAYDPSSAGYVYNAPAVAPSGDVEAARNEAISYAAYRIISARYISSPGGATTQGRLDNRMATLGYDKTFTSTAGDSPAALGNRIAQAYLTRALTDGSNVQNNYADTTGYVERNPPLVVNQSGSNQTDYNHWQPLTITTGGVTSTQHFVTPQWGQVTPFALTRPGGPGSTAAYGSNLVSAPPQFGTDEFKNAALQVLEFSSRLDPAQNTMIDISPGTRGNNALGTNNGHGRAVNPATGNPYTPQVVNQADYGRVLAEFWADGPHSETPPGHWNTIANGVSDQLGTNKHINGVGPAVDDLQWDVKMYFALNGAIGDAAIAAWDNKRQVDYTRPISMIRSMAALGQSSDPSLPHYNAGGLPLQPGLVELVTSETAAPGGRHAGLTPGTVAVHAWAGPSTDGSAAGVAWIEGEDWLPYQANNFVTPAFPAYLSGHSAFSRAAAEVLADYTGSEYFPGGKSGFLFPAGAGLNNEAGPTTDVALQWATYFDASDEAGLSRLYGGIHVRADDFDGRVLGHSIGLSAYSQASLYFNNAVPEPTAGALALVGSALALRRRRA